MPTKQRLFYGPFMVQYLYWLLWAPNRGLGRQPCRVVSISYDKNGWCHGRGRGFELVAPAIRSKSSAVLFARVVDLRYQFHVTQAFFSRSFTLLVLLDAFCKVV